jgi:hypothetical protein
MNMSSAYHPQTDGQMERVNQCVENYLQNMLLDQPQRWTRWLPLAQWWYNSCFHHSLKTSPFQALYGYPPPLSSLGHPPRSQIAAVDTLLRDQHRSLNQLRANLLKAHNQMKEYADLNRTERKFEAGDWVYLKLQPYRQISISKREESEASSSLLWSI